MISRGIWLLYHNLFENGVIMVQELVQAGYKTLSRKYHPDASSSHDTFVLLGKVKDKLMGICNYFIYLL